MDIDVLRYGIYVLIVDNLIIYVGKDSNIHNRERITQHLKQSRYNISKLNKYLQDKDDWCYDVLALFQTKRDMNAFEKAMIRKYQPKFNKQNKKRT